MTGKGEEYQFLQEEIRQRQGHHKFLQIFTLTVSGALFAISVKLRNPFLPLFVLLLLRSLRAQFTQNRYAILRIVAYLRVAQEKDQPDSREKPADLGPVATPPSANTLLFLLSVTAMVLAMALSRYDSEHIPALAIVIATIIIWEHDYWFRYRPKARKLAWLHTDAELEKHWREQLPSTPVSNNG